MIAEEVLENNPELVFYNKNGEIEGIKQNDILWYTFEVIKEHQIRLDELEAAVLALGGSPETLTGGGLEEQLTGLNVQVEGDILIKGHATFSGDTVGQAKMLAGDTRVEVRFDSEYATQPIVNISKSSEITGDYWVSDVTTEHFYIEMSQPQVGDTVFSWYAFGSNDDVKVFSSDGTIENINSTPSILGEEEIVVEETTSTTASSSTDVAQDEPAQPLSGSPASTSTEEIAVDEPLTG